MNWQHAFGRNGHSSLSRSSSSSLWNIYPGKGSAGKSKASHGPNFRRLRIEPLENRWLLSITVNTLADELDGSIDDGDISLRDAIVAAPAGETIDFAGPLDGGTIFLDDLLGELKISGDLIIDASNLPNRLTVNAGHGPDSTPGTGDGMRIFNIDDGDDLTDSSVEIHGLTLIGGDVSGNGGAIRSTETLQLIDSTVTGNATGDGASEGSNGESSGYGGGIWSDGALTLSGSTISDNSTGAGGDGDSAGSSGAGGGIYSLGSLTITNSVISGNSTGDGGDSGGGYGNYAGSSGPGGGIFSDGSLSITDSVISGNFTGEGGSGGYGSNNSYGGGISSDGTLMITNSTISGKSSYFGGGIYAAGLTTIMGGMISGNDAYDGGGVSSYGTTVISGSTISDNTAIFGAGLSTYGTTTISDSTISGNAGEIGGGIAALGTTVIRSSTILENTALDVGGGIITGSDPNNGESFTLINSTVSGNTAMIGDSGYGGYGGGLFNSGGLTLIQHSTITNNTAPVGRGSGVSSNGRDDSPYTYTRTEIRSSIIAGNTNSDVDVNDGPINSFVSQGYNLIGTSVSVPDALTVFNEPGDQTGVANPQLGPLADNGGPTWTHALLAGSPAIEAGDPAGVGMVPLYDQRGTPFDRVANGGQGVPPTIDIGAFELNSLALSADFDRDGDIDGNDFLAWQRGFGIQAPDAIQSDGDANHDQAVNEDDLTVWQDQFDTIPTPQMAILQEGAKPLGTKGVEPDDALAGLSGLAMPITKTLGPVQSSALSLTAKEASLDSGPAHWRVFTQWPDIFQSALSDAHSFGLEYHAGDETTIESHVFADDFAAPGDVVFMRMGTG